MADTFWHGGGRILGDTVWPASVSGVSRSGDVGVFVTSDRLLAEVYAATVEGPAWVYEVVPVGELVAVPSMIAGKPTVSFRCESARIVRRFTIGRARRARLRATVARAGRDLLR